MKRLRVNKYDSLMARPQSFDKYQTWTMSRAWKPKKIEWIYGGGCMPEAAKPMKKLPEEGIDITLFTDKDVLSPMVDMAQTKYKVVYLSECRSIHPFAYEWIIQVEDKFDLILTHDADLLKRGPKYVKNVLGTSWVDDSEAKMYKKTKLVSHIVSKNKWARGHNLRHVIAKAVKGRHDVDLWGSAVKPFVSKTEPLKDYMFSITVMNAKHDHYFTETLVDTFRCGTIPIFWGCENIGEYFNEKGILRFNTGEQLFEILDGLSEGKYLELLPYTQENFEIAKKYVCVDDIIAENIITTLGLDGYE
jgi:hypothetical protein